MKALFVKRSGAGYLLLGLIAASATLLYLDSTTRLLQPARAVLNTVVGPGRFVMDSPYMLAAQLGAFFSSRTALMRRFDHLEQRNLELSAIAQEAQALKTENDRMRELLGSRARLPAEVLIAELIGVVPTPDTQQVVIDKGASAGVRIGQAVIDATGLFGQIVDVGLHTSRVLLITDLSHAVPVEVSRSGLRSIAGGTGRIELLLLENLPATADIRRGDLLVSSGLGGRFPRGYPVGRVQSVLTESTRGFSRASVEPSALLDASRHLLVVLDAADAPEPAP